MTGAALALARSRGYGLLARLVVEGPTPALLERVAQTPLAEALPIDPDPDALAATHQALFSWEVFPYAGVFLEPEGLLGGPSAEGFAQHSRRLGFTASLIDTSADHIGGVLGLLSWLSGAEADAAEDGLEATAEQLRGHLRATLDRWLLPWLLPFSAAVLDRREPLWSALTELLLELVITHRAALGGQASAPPLPAPPAGLLDDPKTGLRRIARTLLAPCYSGVFLSRADIAALARRRDTPAGFGGRVQMLTNLLRNAAEYSALPALVQAMDETILTRRERATALASVGLPQVFVAPWISRMDQTRGVLARLAAAG